MQGSRIMVVLRRACVPSSSSCSLQLLSRPFSTRDRATSTRIEGFAKGAEGLGALAQEAKKTRNLPGIDVEKENLMLGAIDKSGFTGEQKALLERIASFELSSNKDVVKQIRRRLVEKYQRFEGDTGSTEVQIATISLRLSNLAEHMLKNHKDNHTKRGMTALFHRRRKLMQYLRRERFELYEQALIDFKIDETEVLEWGRMPGRMFRMSRFPKMNEFKKYRESREAHEQDEYERAVRERFNRRQQVAAENEKQGLEASSEAEEKPTA